VYFGTRVNIDELKRTLRDFAAERDWEQFHSPKNLSMALSVEVAELVEHFQWLSEAQSRDLPPETTEQVTQELADIQIYLVRLADKLDIDIEAAVTAKMKLNRLKYPVDKARGSAAKYTTYDSDSSE
jgi:NTP pyrophosphatase (non-canonical NTP hydrolase)